MNYIITAWNVVTESAVVFPSVTEFYDFDKMLKVYRNLSEDERFIHIRISYIIGV